MCQTIIDDQNFITINYTTNKLFVGQYCNCQFTTCNFENSDLAYQIFEDCTFSNCNLSMATLNQTSLKNVTFKDCKMMGLRFDNCKPFLFEVSFLNCQLQLSSFYGWNVKKTVFAKCILHEVDFTNADLSFAVLDECDAARAIFNNTNLQKAQLQTAYNFSINPVQNNITEATFSKYGLEGLLEQYKINVV